MAWGYLKTVKIIVPLQIFGGFFRGILKRKSFLINVVGSPGKGKSLTVSSICEMTNPGKFRERDTIRRLKDVNTRMKEIEESKAPFWVLHLDDFGRQLDPNKFNTAQAMAASWVFQTNRPLKVGCFLTVPDREFVNKTFRDRLPNFEIEVIGHNKISKMAKMRLFRIQRNQRTGKVYRHRIFYCPKSKKLSIIKEDGYIPLEDFSVPLPSQEFLDWYIPFRKQIAINNLDAERQEEEEDLAEFTMAQEEKSKVREKIVLEQVAKKNLLLEEWAQKILLLPQKYTKLYGKRTILNRSAVSLGLELKIREIDLLSAYMNEKGYIK
jgi:hypothetical protein